MRYDNYCFPTSNEYGEIDDILLAFISIHSDVKISLEFKDFPIRILHFKSGVEVNFRKPKEDPSGVDVAVRMRDSSWGPNKNIQRSILFNTLEGLYQELN